MLTFKEFRKKNDWLPYEQQKDCYKWYLNGIQEALAKVKFKSINYQSQRSEYCDECDCIFEAIDSVNEELNENLEDIKE